MQLGKDKLLLAKLDRFQKDIVQFQQNINDFRELIGKPATLDVGPGKTGNNISGASNINWTDPDTIYHQEGEFTSSPAFSFDRSGFGSLFLLTVYASSTEHSQVRSVHVVCSY